MHNNNHHSSEEGSIFGPILSPRGYNKVMYQNAALPIYLIFGSRKLPSDAPQAGSLTYLQAYLLDNKLQGGITDYYYISTVRDVASSVNWRAWVSWIEAPATVASVTKALKAAGWKFGSSANHWTWEFSSESYPNGQFQTIARLIPKPGSPDNGITLAAAAAEEGADLDATLAAFQMTSDIYVTPEYSKKWGIPVITSTSGADLPLVPQPPSSVKTPPAPTSTKGALPPSQLPATVSKPVPASSKGDIVPDMGAEIGTVAFIKGKAINVSDVEIARRWIALAVKLRTSFAVYFSKFRKKANSADDVRNAVLTAARNSQFGDYVKNYELLFPALMANESAWNRTLVNEIGAAGLLQWVPQTYRNLASKYGIKQPLVVGGKPAGAAVQGVYLGAYIFDMFATSIRAVYDVQRGQWKPLGSQLKRLMATECSDVNNPYLATCWLITFSCGTGGNPYIYSAPKGRSLNRYTYEFVDARKAVMAAVIGSLWAKANISNFEKFA